MTNSRMDTSTLNLKNITCRKMMGLRISSSITYIAPYTDTSYR